MPRLASAGEAVMDGDEGIAGCCTRYEASRAIFFFNAARALFSADSTSAG
jgi:hypothetical protein